MKLTHETGTAAIIQFIVLSLLNILNALDSIISTCRHSGGDCVGNLLSSVILYMLIVGWFAIVAGLGIYAQEKRSKRATQLLIAAEGVVMILALLNIKLGTANHSGALSLGTSFIDLVLAFWVMSLAFRLLRAGPGRVRVRRRPPTSQPSE